MHLVPPYSSMFGWVLFLLRIAVVWCDWYVQQTTNRQEDEDPNYVDVPEGDDNEGKS